MKYQMKKSRLCLALLLAMLFLMTACSTTSPSQGTSPAATTSQGTTPAATGPEYGGILKIVTVGEGAMPIGVPWEDSGSDIEYIWPALQPLLHESKTGEYTPFLATEWEVDTVAATLTLKLQQGVKFQDGTDFNAEAAKWNLNHQMEVKTISSIKSVDVIDDYTIRLNYTAWQNTNLNDLSSSRGCMISPTAFDTNGIEWARIHPVGTGAFKLESYNPGSELKYTKFDGYWEEGLPYLDGITYLYIKDPMTQQAALLATGDDRIDILRTSSGEMASQLQAKGLDVEYKSVGPVSLVGDNAHPDSIYANKLVREAISYAIDRESIVNARGFGLWKPAYQFIAADNPAYVQDFVGQHYDPEKAKELLAEAGYPDGFTARIVAQPSYSDRDAMVIIQNQLEQVGIKVDLEFPDSGGYNDIRANGWDNLMLAGLTRTMPTFNQTYRSWFSGRSIIKSDYFKGPEGFLDILEKSLATAELDPSLGQQMTQMLNEDVTAIPLYEISDIWITQLNVHDTGCTETYMYSPERAWKSN